MATFRIAAAGAIQAAFESLFPSGTSLSSAGKIAVPYVVAKSGVAVSGAADTSENILATITIPAGAMGPNGQVRITTLFSYTNSANNKILRIRFGGIGGTVYMGLTMTTSAQLTDQRTISNRNSQSSQVGMASGVFPSYNGSAGPTITSSVDTSASTTIVITGQKASAGETLTLESYSVEIISDGT